MPGLRRLRRHWLAAIIVPALALRALVPAGFMWAPVGGQWEFVLCGSGSALARHDHAHHGATVDPRCPFAQSTGPAPLPTLPVFASAIATPSFERPSVVAQTTLLFGPPRQQAPRGPPQLA